MYVFNPQPSLLTHLLYYLTLTLPHLHQRQDALNLVVEAISAGIFNDLGSGSNVDACVITKDHTETLRNYRKLNERPQKENTYRFRRGTTAWTKESIRSLVVDETIVPLPPPVSTAGDAMDTS